MTPVFDYAKREGLVDNDCLKFDNVNTATVACPTELAEC